MKNNTQNLNLISIEELAELEYNLEYNPFDTIGTGYLEDDFTEEIKRFYKQAIDYYSLMDNINK